MWPKVPNAPCGVESPFLGELFGRTMPFLMHRVELKATSVLYGRHGGIKFLMHRVELKGKTVLQGHTHFPPVPNAPCGVERNYWLGQKEERTEFLMHRVELKVASSLTFYTPLFRS